MVIQLFFRQRIVKLLEHVSSKKWGNRWGLESGSERGDISSVSEHVMTERNYRKVAHV